MTPELMVELYSEGSITEYELFSRMRHQGWEKELPEELKKDFKEWNEKHPRGSGEYSFTISA
jgi:hypothetical protein